MLIIFKIITRQHTIWLALWALKQYIARQNVNSINNCSVKKNWSYFEEKKSFDCFPLPLLRVFLLWRFKWSKNGHDDQALWRLKSMTSFNIIDSNFHWIFYLFICIHYSTYSLNRRTFSILKRTLPEQDLIWH